MSGSLHEFRASLYMKGRSYHVGDKRFEASHLICLGVSAPQLESVEWGQRGAYTGDGQLCHTCLVRARPPIVPNVWEVVDNEQIWRARTENQSWRKHLGLRQKNELQPGLHWGEEREGDGGETPGTGIAIIIILIPDKTLLYNINDNAVNELFK